MLWYYDDVNYSNQRHMNDVNLFYELVDMLSCQRSEVVLDDDNCEALKPQLHLRLCILLT